MRSISVLMDCSRSLQTPPGSVLRSRHWAWNPTTCVRALVAVAIGVYEDRFSKRSITCCKNPPSAALNSTILVASKFNGDMNELEKTYIPHLCPQFERGCTLQSRLTSELVQRIGQCTSPMTVEWSSRSIDRIARQPGSSVLVEIAS